MVRRGQGSVPSGNQQLLDANIFHEHNDTGDTRSRHKSGLHQHVAPAALRLRQDTRRRRSALPDRSELTRVLERAFCSVRVFRYGADRRYSQNSPSSP